MIYYAALPELAEITVVRDALVNGEDVLLELGGIPRLVAAHLTSVLARYHNLLLR